MGCMYILLYLSDMKIRAEGGSRIIIKLDYLNVVINISLSFLTKQLLDIPLYNLDRKLYGKQLEASFYYVCSQCSKDKLQKGYFSFFRIYQKIILSFKLHVFMLLNAQSITNLKQQRTERSCATHSYAKPNGFLLHGVHDKEPCSFIPHHT